MESAYLHQGESGPDPEPISGVWIRTADPNDLTETFFSNSKDTYIIMNGC